jgi:PAS domain S-box-containing protein
VGTSLAAEPLLALAVTVTSEQRVDSVLQSIVDGLASQPGVALARIWLVPSADLRSFFQNVPDPPDCLCLVASAGTPVNSPGEDWCFLQGQFARVPFNVGKVGQVAASRHPILVEDVNAQNDWVVRPEWAKREEIRSFAGHPLIYRDKLLGVIGVFSRLPLGEKEFTWLGLFASQAAVAIANARTEESLRSSERNLAAIINTIPTTAWTTRPDGYCDFLNQVWLDYAGMTTEQAQGWGWAEAIHPEDRKKLVEEWQSCLASGTPVDTEARIRRFDGSYRWFLIRGNPLRDESGNILKWYGTCTNIDDRKQAEETLRARELSWRQIVDNIPGLVATTGALGQIEFLNRQTLEFFGQTAEELKDWALIGAVHPDDLPRVIKARKESIELSQIYEDEHRCRRADGVYRWLYARGIPVRDAGNKITAWYLLLTDIDDRKKAEEALQASELDARSLLDNMPGFLGRHSPDGTPEIVNRTFLQYFGKTVEEIRKWRTSDLVHPDDLARTIEVFGGGISGGQPWSLEFRLRRFDGVYRWFQARWIPVRDLEGRILHWNALTTDIDDRKQAEQALQASERNLSLITNAIPALIHTARPDGYLDYFNQRWLEYLGCSLSDVEGWKWTTWIHPDDLQGIVDEWRACLASGEIFEYETRVRRADGQYRWMFHRKVPVRDEHGNIIRWYGTSLDIEDRKRTEWLRAAEIQTLQMITGGAKLSDVLNNLCSIIDDHTSATSFVCLMDREGKHLSVFAGPHLPPAFATAITPLQIGLNRGSCGTAAFTKYRVIIPDVSDDPRWPDDARDLALSNGVCAAWSEPLLWTGGEVIGTFCISHSEPRVPDGRDIELIEAAARIALVAIERQRSQEALRDALDQILKSEFKLRQVIDAIPALAWCNLPDGSNEFLNKRWHEYTGLSPEQSHGWGWQAVFHPEDLPPLMEKWMKMLVSGEPDEIEARLHRYDGVYRWFLIRAEPFRDESGKIVRWYGTSTDIEDRKQAEAQVEQAYLRLAEAQRLSKTGSFVTDLQADDHNWSEEAFRIFEFDPASKVTMQMIRDCIYPGDVPSFDAVIASGMTGTDVDFVFRIVTSGGAIKHIRGLARVMAQSGGRPLFIGAFQDVTESKIAEEALDRARSELAHVARVTTLNALTASIAHEINQPLSGIITNAGTCLRMLDGDPPNVDGARETVRRTIRDGNRASDVISRLRALYSKKEFTLEQVDLNEATREVVALSWHDLQRNRVVLRWELAEELPLVVGDRVQLQQVILNLLRNASDAMNAVDDRPRELLIRTERGEKGQVGLSVKDVGWGFTCEAEDKLFQAFYTTKTDGMGIGLSVSRSIIEAHHGRLWATANDGPGATLSFTLPSRIESFVDDKTRADRPDPATNAA